MFDNNFVIALKFVDLSIFKNAVFGCKINKKFIFWKFLSSKKNFFFNDYKLYLVLKLLKLI